MQPSELFPTIAIVVANNDRRRSFAQVFIACTKSMSTWSLSQLHSQSISQSAFCQSSPFPLTWMGPLSWQTTQGSSRWCSWGGSCRFGWTVIGCGIGASGCVASPPLSEHLIAQNLMRDACFVFYLVGKAGQGGILAGEDNRPGCCPQGEVLDISVQQENSSVLIELS